MPGEEGKPNQLIKSVDRALNIIERLVSSRSGMKITELSDSLGLHKSTVHRFLDTLSYRGYVEQDPETRTYKIGLKFFEIGSKVLNNLDLRKQVRPYLRDLRQETGETVHLGVLDRGMVVYIDKEESEETIRMYSRIGKRVFTHCTSLGKVLLAFSAPEIMERVVEKEGLPGLTKNTITDIEELRKHLQLVKTAGYAIDNEEHQEGIRCIGGPIFDYRGEAVAAFSVAGPTMRITEKRVEKLSSLIVSYSEKISASLGFNS
ncbi:MAG: IclR family transcriptional regulator [Halanaerobiaceae bacterium]